MSGALTAKALAPVLAEAPALVHEALQALYDPRDDPLDLDAVAVAARGVGRTTAAMLAMILNEDGLSDAFVAFLAAHARPLDGPAFAATVARLKADSEAALGGLVGIAFDEEKLAAFALRSKSFRCRVRVNGKVTGCGALVSPRLVLTAQHVIATANGAAPRLEVEGPDGRRHPATVALAVPPHEAEKTGGLPPAEGAATHSDVALLRLDVPLGRRYAQVDLPPTPVPCNGKSAFVLVHFPGGKASGISFGEIDRSDCRAVRHAHTAKAANGSSGGPGFDAEFRFLGLHQGRLGKVKRIVPFEQFSANADFRARIEGDRQVRYLWSLDGSPEGHLVIGRQTYFDALAAIAAGEAPALRGIWVRRKSIAESAGLAFSHDLLGAFLDASAHRIVRLPIEIEVGDVVARLHAEVFAAAPPEAASGVRLDETTRVAHDEDRARALADAIQAQAVAEGRTIWIFVENPPAGMLQDAQVQFEHLVAELLLRSAVRLVLAGFETCVLAETVYETVAEARTGTLPGLLAEYIGEFTEADVHMTATEMARAMGYDWGAEVLTRIVRLALAGLPAQGGYYPVMHLASVADRLRAEARREEGGG